MVAAEAAACGAPPLVARHSGLAEVAEGLEAEYPPQFRDLAGFENGDGRRARGEARGDPAGFRRPTTRRCARRPAVPRSSAGAGNGSPL